MRKNLFSSTTYTGDVATNRDDVLRVLDNPHHLMALLLGGMTGEDNKVYNPGVDRTGDKIIIPEGAHLPDVIRSLQMQHQREDQVMAIHVTIPVSPWDGAYALEQAIGEQLGVVIQKERMHGADQIDVEVDLNKTIQIAWGTFELPSMEGAEVSTGTTFENGRMVFQCHVECKRKYVNRIRRLLDAVRVKALKESLHRGKAFSIEFTDDDGNRLPLPAPKFFPLSDEEPVYQQGLTSAIERNIFVPIRHAKELLEMGETLKRGALFAGMYGTGKTLLASKIAKVAVASGWTFIYVKDSTELPEALRYAEQYQPVVVFAEDVDRVAGSSRTNAVNELLNQLDGIDSKSSQIMTILTSNHPEQINAAMRRPGRIDVILEVLPPDEEAVGRMIAKFAGTTLDSSSDLSEVSKVLAGETPARVRETIGRAKLEALRRTGDAKAMITGNDLLAVAKEVKAESQLFRKENTTENTHNVIPLADAFSTAGAALRKSAGGH